MGRPKNFTREHVLQTAMPVFWERGFADTGLHDLEKATGVNKSGLYAEFENKDDLFLACLRYYVDARFSDTPLMQEPLGWHNIESFLMRDLDCSECQKGCFAISVQRESAIVPGEAKKILASSKMRLRRDLEANVRAENSRMDPKLVAEMVLTYFSGLCTDQNLLETKTASIRKIRTFMQMLRSA